ncbi:hypothetical protein Ddye_016447 [Dipteronia dyeriana]|uniref:RING-type E3 ubiquitin transferase n=1 Tax=Dipteronia dyeriana TaxID=168575 RepID=A0AAD9U7F0_9ROSI|nr:hypothetical protein Ddye_016447 [Dipteronia dyeriana]
MAANAILFFLLFATRMSVDTQASQPNCPPAKCGHGAPEIRFPFWLKGQQPHHCGHPGFELSCKENTTMIHFPSFGDLVVKSISYHIKKLDLLDPGNCVHGVFLNLNLSLTLFRYYYIVKNYKYINCSARLPTSSFSEIPCLSTGSRDHHIYTVKSSLAVPFSCREVKTIAIPFAYSPYLSDNSFGLGLTWNTLSRCDHQDCKAKTSQKGIMSKSGFLNIAQDAEIVLV